MMDDHKKRDKTLGKETKQGALTTFGLRYVSEAILDPSAPDEPPSQHQVQPEAIPAELCLKS